MAFVGDLIGIWDEAPGPDRTSALDLGSFLHFYRACVSFSLFRGPFCKSVPTGVGMKQIWGPSRPLSKKKPRAYAQEIAGQKYILRIFTNIYVAAPKSISGQQLPQILPPSN
jgi:hypothetical protein